MSCLDILRLPLDWVHVLSYWTMGQNWRRCRCFHWLILGRKRHWVKTRHPKQSHCLKLTQQWLIASLAHNLKSGNYVCNGMLSSTGRVAINLAAAYSVTKYGVEGFSDVLRREMHPWGIKVSMVEPGAPNSNDRPSYAWKTIPTSLEWIKCWAAEGLRTRILGKGYSSIYLIYLHFPLQDWLYQLENLIVRKPLFLKRKAVPRSLNCNATATKRNRVDKCDVTLPR